VRLAFDPDALEDLRFFVDTDRKLALKVLSLLEAICKSPFEGIGKPEPLKHELAGCWSRRVNQEHRLVYCVESNTIVVLGCRYH
jgi:toxin YoeB